MDGARLTLRTKILPAPVAPAALPRAALQAAPGRGPAAPPDHGGRRRRLRQVGAPGGLGPAPRRRLVHARCRGRGALHPRPRPRRRAAPARARSARSTWRRRPAPRAAPTPAPTRVRAPTPSPPRCPRRCRSACAGRWRSSSTTSTRWRPTAPRCERSRRSAARRPRPCTSCSPRGPSRRSRSTACAVRARSSSSAAPTSPSMPTRCVPCSRPSSTATRASSARRCTRSPRAGPRPCASPARRCAGWQPAQRGAAVERLRRPGGALFGYLAREVLAQEAPGVRELVRVAAPLERVHPRAVRRARGRGGARRARLARAPRAVRRDAIRSTRWFAPTGLMRDVALASLPLADDDLRDAARPRRRVVRGARRARAGPALAGAPSATTPPPRGCWPSTGRRCCARGPSRRSSRRAPRCPPCGATRRFERLLGEAHQLARRLGRTLARGRGGGLPPGRRGASGDLAPLLRRGTPSAHWLRGDAEPVPRRLRRAQAHEVAVASGEDRALAAAHTVLAMLAALEGDRASNDAHYLRALDHAERAGDVLQIIRIRVNRGSRNLEEGAYEAAIVELDLAIRLADLGGFGAFRALALTNRGESRLRLGPPGGGDRRPRRRAPDLPAPRLRRRRLPAGHPGRRLPRARRRGARPRRLRGGGAPRRRHGRPAGARPRARRPRPRPRRRRPRAGERPRAARGAGYGAGMGEAAALLAVGHVALAAVRPRGRGAGGRPGRHGGPRPPRPRPDGRGARARGPGGRDRARAPRRRSSRPSRSGTSSATPWGRTRPAEPSP